MAAMEQSMHIGMTLSLLAHAAILLVMSGAQVPLRHERPPKDIEVSYYRLAERPPLATPMVSAPARLPAPPTAPPRDRTRSAPVAPVLLEPHAAQQALTQKPQIPDSIDLSNLTQLSTNAVAYVDYFRLLRERIRQAALRRYPSRNIQGEVFLTFTVTADGAVPDAHVLESKSTPDVGLRTAGLESLREAAPFPPFPKTLNRPQMTFHIIISYELGSR